MSQNEPRDHHYAPQFYLRNFSVDEERLKIPVLAKQGSRLIWMVRSIATLGYERDFYMHTENGAPVSVEADINRRIETPISKSETWRKLVNGQAASLDRTDRAILYGLIRHFKARTPHAFDTAMELAQLAADPDCSIPFTAEERDMYAFFRASPQKAKAFLNMMASNVSWTRREFETCSIRVLRSSVPLRASTTAVFSLHARPQSTYKLPLPGMTPYVEVLPLDPFTLAILMLGEFDGDFANSAMTQEEERFFGREFIGIFRHFPSIQHLVTGREGLEADLSAFGCQLLKSEDRKMVFSNPFPTVSQPREGRGVGWPLARGAPADR